MCVCLHTKFQVSSIDLTSFRLSSLLPQNEPLKNPPRLRLNNNGSNPTNLGGNPLYYNLDMVQDTANFKANQLLLILYQVLLLIDYINSSFLLVPAVHDHPSNVVYLSLAINANFSILKKQV